MLVGQHKSMYRCTSGIVPMHCALGQDLRCRAGDKHAHTKSAADMSLNIQSNTSRCCADLKRAYVDLWETCNTQASPALFNALQPKWCIAYPQNNSLSEIAPQTRQHSALGRAVLRIGSTTCALIQTECRSVSNASCCTALARSKADKQSSKQTPRDLHPHQQSTIHVATHTL